MSLTVGDQAPDFSLRDQNNEERSLSQYRGSANVLLMFYPLAFSGICTGELDRIRDELDTFHNSGVEVLGISVDSVFALKVWSRQQGYEFPLLADFWPHGAVAQLYEVFNDAAGTANRGTFLVDKESTIRFAEMNQPGEPRDQTVWKQALARLAS